MTNKTVIKQNKSAGANLLENGLNWVDERFPLTSNIKAHLTEYYTPKNFNFWYYFGSLSLLVLVLQILTGIFLTMHYKPDAELAFGSVEYIMRDLFGQIQQAFDGLYQNMFGGILKILIFNYLKKLYLN